MKRKRERRREKRREEVHGLGLFDVEALQEGRPVLLVDRTASHRQRRINLTLFYKINYKRLNKCEKNEKKGKGKGDGGRWEG